MATELKRMKQRRDTTAAWAALNPVLMNGEIGVDTVTRTFRVGDGVTPWLSLSRSLGLSDLTLMLSYVQLSKDWAEKGEDLSVTEAPDPEGFSSYHWAKKSQGQAGIASGHATAAYDNRLLTNADVVLTHADVVLTHADVVLTHADVVTTGELVVEAEEAVAAINAKITVSEDDPTGGVDGDIWFKVL